MSFYDQNNLPSDMHYNKKLISEIQLDDEALYLIGTAKNKNESDEFVLDDGTGTIPVREIPEQNAPIVNENIYRVLGTISIDGSGTRYLAAKICKLVEGINLELYQKALKMKKDLK